MAAYDTHKGQLDAAMPTPGIVWQHIENQEGGGYHRVAQFYSEFAGESYTYIVQAIDSGGLHFEIAQVGPTGAPRLHRNQWG